MKQNKQDLTPVSYTHLPPDRDARQNGRSDWLRQNRQSGGKKASPWLGYEGADLWDQASGEAA